MAQASLECSLARLRDKVRPDAHFALRHGYCIHVRYYRLCGGEVCVQSTLQNYVDCSQFSVCLHAEGNSHVFMNSEIVRFKCAELLFQPKTNEPPDENNIIACAKRHVGTTIFERIGEHRTVDFAPSTILLRREKVLGVIA